LFPFLQSVRNIFERNENLEEEKSGILPARASENRGSLRPFFGGIYNLKTECVVNGKILCPFTS